MIREASPGDAPAIWDVVRAGFETYRSFAPAGWQPPQEDPAEHARELADPATFGLVAEEDGVVVGHVRWVPARTPSRDGTTPDIHFRHLFVLPSHWGSGIALELHARAIAAMRGTARLFTPAGQARARRFYEREGWRLHEPAYFDPRIAFDIVEYRREQPG